MPKRITEQLHAAARGLERRPLAEIATILAEGQHAAAAIPTLASDAIAAGGSAMAKTIAAGARLHYVAAGSSALMAAADAMELGGTFSIPSRQIRIHMAGGLPTSAEMPGGTEDETDQIERDLADLTAEDTVIAVSASGTTPFTLRAAEIARAAGACIVGIANNAGSQLLNMSDHAVALPTPPEVLSGSTRMGAGTAQKIALNMLSTLMAVELGHVHDGMMVNLTADNIKLVARAQSIVADVAAVDAEVAKQALDAAQGQVKPAILIAAGAKNITVANTLLEESKGHLRPALDRLQIL